MPCLENITLSRRWVLVKSLMYMDSLHLPCAVRTEQTKKYKFQLLLMEGLACNRQE
jgi:hypothetical protein